MYLHNKTINYALGKAFHRPAYGRLLFFALRIQILQRIGTFEILKKLWYSFYIRKIVK